MKKALLFFALLFITLSTFAAKKPVKTLVLATEYGKNAAYTEMFSYAKSKGYKHVSKVDCTATYVLYYFVK